jgi:hypothetical protein
MAGEMIDPHGEEARSAISNHEAAPSPVAILRDGRCAASSG